MKFVSNVATEMYFKDERLQVFNVLSSFSEPRADGDIQEREDWMMGCDSQAVTTDGSRDLFKIVQNSSIGDIHYHPSNPLECEDTAIKDDQGLSSAMSTLTEAFAQCSFLAESNQVEMERSDDLMERFASFFKQRIEDALEPLRAPVAFVFQKRWEVERKRRQDFLAVEEKKLVIRRKKIELMRRRGGRVRRSTRKALSNFTRSSGHFSLDEVKALCSRN